jgi:hypothetical protein
MSDEKDIIPSKYRRGYKSKVTIDDLVRYLGDHEVTPEEALEYVITASRIDPTHPRTEWKLFRFTLYLWERDREYKKGKLQKKKDTCIAVVNSKKFKDIYRAYTFNSKVINETKEADNLYKLVGDVRQRPFFKKRFYKYERTQQQMHQEHIDKIR